jgi:trans-aconitate 2-methyltransferase
MPYHFRNPAHLVIEETKADPRWRELLQGVGLHQQSVMPLLWYVERLHDRGFTVDALADDLHPRSVGRESGAGMVQGDGAATLLKVLEPQAQAEFLRELGERLKAAYPPKGSVSLLPFPRLFFVSTRGR